MPGDPMDVDGASDAALSQTPKRPKARTASQRQSVAGSNASSYDTEKRRAPRQTKSKGRIDLSSLGADFKPSDSGTKSSDELDADEEYVPQGIEDGEEESDEASPEGGDSDEGDFSDRDVEADDMDTPSPSVAKGPRPARKKQNKKDRNTPVALHRRMIRRMKDISYWGDHEVDPTAVRRKEAARPFLYDISAPSRGHISTPWYLDLAKEAQDLARDTFIERTSHLQRFVELDRTADAATISKYFWRFPKRPLDLFLGPIARSGQQKKFQLKMYDSVSLDGPDLFHSKNGWVLHAGNEIQSLDWATRQHGSVQFLAIGTKFQEAKPTLSEQPPGFAPCVCPSQIQIWRIPISEPSVMPKPPSTVDYTFLTDWGAPIEIKWRPGIAPTPTPSILGHIMALFEDGKARLIEIPHRPASSPAPLYHLTNPMLTLHLRDALFTVFTWLDHHTIAFGCSNGCIAIYDLNSTHPGKEHLPNSYYSLHASYVASIASLGPSFPHLLATYSMDGSFHIHDLREANPTNTLVHRSRTVAMSTPVAWSEMAQSLCYPEDLTGILCMGVRKARRFGGFLCSNAPGDSIATSTAGLHPFLLSGGRDGRVRIVNLIRKYFYSKCQAMQQVWFQLEYAPSTEMYRMLDGFKPEMVVHRNRVGIGLPFFSYHTNVTKVCWNGNREFGTWAAAGMGCGLVRVEDVSLDVHQAVPQEGEVD
ncbi:hypothetical protein Dda_8566 [Drechslerella dactyloides]|uniref:Uncharacterized protein n=1 Tax=Drechslerella dactyloides TaxID=74499 RepID=A0AAD6IQK6_DREDA|nr:hypothetical protein Dda_8566 [Drechslerella dactyloides]